MLSHSNSIYWSPYYNPQVLAESLLSSGLQSNITLGGQLLACNSHQLPIQTDTISSEVLAKKKTAFVCKIPFRESVELVLSSAREYFNSASNPTDHEMVLARWVGVAELMQNIDRTCNPTVLLVWPFRYCLDLIKEPVDDIITEYHLIEAIGILATCQASLIPVQGVIISYHSDYYSNILVRLCEHKLEIVRQVLQSNPALCKDSTKVFIMLHQMVWMWVGL